MMERRYKVIISNRNLYKEAELDGACTEMLIGTDKNCDLRLHEDMFFEPVELAFFRNEGKWTARVSRNLYMSPEGQEILKLQSVDVDHGDILTVRYRGSDAVVFSAEFVMDFDSGLRKYNRYADCAGMNVIRIGNVNDSNIVPGGQFAGADHLELYRRGDGFELNILYSAYGVLINGNRAATGDIIKNGDFFSVADHYFYLRNDHLWTDRDSGPAFYGMKTFDSVNRGSYPRFKRSSRIRIVPNEEKIPVIDPSAKPKKPRNNLLLRLLPSVGMLMAAAVMASVGGSFMIVFSLVSVTVAVITAVLTFRQNNKDYVESLEERRETYYRYIAAKREEIERCRNEERQILEEIYISLDQEKTNIHRFSPALFDRVKDDADFLCVRLGTGDIPSKREIDYKKQERLEPGDDLQQIPQMLCEEYKNVYSVPVVCDLKEINALGIIGPEPYRFELLKNIILDLAARHYHSDVSMVIAAGQKNKERIRWMRMLPNLFNAQLGIRNLVMDEESRTLIFEYLYKELSLREQKRGFANRIVVFMYDECGLASHPLYRFLEKAGELGVTFIFFGDTGADIPVGCDKMVVLEGDYTGYLINAKDRKDTVRFLYPVTPEAEEARIIQLLAPVETDEISLEGSLTKSISMFGMLGIIAASDLDLEKRWSQSNVTVSMAAPLGVTKTGILSLDLHDRAHGPHGLVAGTTGSGKSEVLQTYILAMATLYHPYEAGFVIIDFKGGGMVNQFEKLPHLMGAITNIDGKEIERSLKSIKAELQKRQRLFAEAEVNHIDKYIRLYKKGSVREPLPHLIIIVDEFAELKAEQPEFMKELISAARIGRSLGVHLILATQKPAGQVSEQIWSNSRFRLCLKVQSREDSNEVIKSPLAAEIKEPGRAYLQVGNNEIFELFQSAYSGAPEKADDSSVKEFSVIELTDSGRRVPVYVQKKPKTSSNRTQLDAIVSHVEKYCADSGIVKLPDICLPSLEERIHFPETADLLPKDPAVTTEIGIYDDPDRQYQGVFSMSLSEQNIMIIGSSQSGKTNVLQTMIRSIASKYSPDEVSVYIIDFASMVLKNFEDLAHVGGVVTSTEDEKLKNLFKMLFADIEKRKERMLLAGVSSFAAYKEAGHTDLPQIVLMIDNLTALREMYFKDDDELIRLCREGLSAGISVVVANSQTAGIGYRYLSNFAGRIALFCNDSNEYNTLFEHCRMRLDDIRGRAIIESDKADLECQTFLAFEGQKEIDRVNAIRAFIDERNRECFEPAGGAERAEQSDPEEREDLPGDNGLVRGAATGKQTGRMLRARRIPEIPEKLTAEYVYSEYASMMQKEYRLVAGMDFASVEPVLYDLSSVGLVTISGRSGMGQKGFLSYLLRTCEEKWPGRTRVYIVDNLDKEFREFESYTNVASYDHLSMKLQELVLETEKELSSRYEALVGGDERTVADAPLIILLINDMEALRSIGNDPAASAAFDNITGRLRTMKALIILSSFENVQVNYSAPAPVKKAKEQSCFLYFDDLQNLKVRDIPLTAVRQFKKTLAPGECYWIRDNEILKLKTPSLG